MTSRIVRSGALSLAFALSFPIAAHGECVTSGSDDCPEPRLGGWCNDSFDPESGQFTFTFDATPGGPSIDAITALSFGAGADFDEFACLIRFSPAGFIDVRNGSVYDAESPMPYSGGQTFSFRAEIDVAAHTYSVFVTPPGDDDETMLACSYDFRTEQQTVTSLDHWAVWASDGFEHETCDVAFDSGPGVTINVPADHATIQEAVDAAAFGDEIVVAPGTYDEALLVSKFITLRSAGGRDVTTIDATSVGGSVVASCCDVVLEGFTIEGGTGTPVPGRVVGGGLYNANCRATVLDCRFCDNGAEGQNEGFGGAIYSQVAPVFRDTTVTDCEFFGNRATGGDASGGGAIYGGALVAGCTFEDNRCGAHNSSGGGVNKALVISGCTFIDNFAQGGGGAAFTSTASGRLVDSRFFSNVADVGGGVDCAVPTEVVNCVFIGNRGRKGAGGLVPASTVAIHNSTFVNNDSQLDFGGAIGCTVFSHPPCIPPTVVNCILWGNTPHQIDDADVSYSLVQDGQPGTCNINVAPVFVDADGDDDVLGTADDDVSLSHGSPGIDAGDNGAVPPDVPFDIAGNPRISDDPLTMVECAGSGAIVDMGAHELQPPSASEHFWIDPGGGSFQDSANWFVDVPGPEDKAIFFRPEAYTVSFTGHVSNDSLTISGGDVVFDLGTSTYTLESQDEEAVTIGTIGGVDAALSLEDGTLEAFAIQIGDEGAGTLEVRSTATALVTNGLLIEKGGLLTGDGTIIGDVVNLDDVRPGSIGSTLTIVGNYSQTGTLANGSPTTGTLHIEIDADCSTNDLLDVEQVANLSGSLVVTLEEGCVPTLDSMFTILEAAEITHFFDTALFPALPNDTFMHIVYAPASGLGPFTEAIVEVTDLESLLIGFEAQDPVSASTSGAPTDAILADFDDDGLDELAICVRAGSGGQPGHVLVFDFDDAASGFQQVQEISTGAGNDPAALTAGPFDLDQDIDLAVYIRRSGNDSVSIIYNDGSGTFGAATPIAFVGSAPDFEADDQRVDIATARFDPACRSDVACAHDLVVITAATDGVVPLFNGGNGTFEAGEPMIAGNIPSSGEPGDLDNPKDIGEDFVVVNQGSSTVSIFRFQGGVDFDDPLTVPVGDDPNDVELVDLDLDLQLDIVTANGDGSISIVLIDDFPEAEQSASTIPVGEPGEAAISVTSLDMDLDGDLDLAVLMSSGRIVPLRNDLELGQVQFVELTEPDTEQPPFFVLSGRVDSDGDEDLVAVAESIGGGAIGPPATTSSATSFLDNLASCTGDIDLNGNVGFADLIQILIGWGECEDPCPADLDRSGAVGFNDLTLVLVNWGPCVEK